MGFVWCGSGPVLCCFAVFLLAKRKSGREICGSSLLPFFCLFSFFVCVSMMCLSCEAKEFHIFCITFLPLLSLSGPSLRARSAATEENKKQVARSGVAVVFPYNECKQRLWLVDLTLFFPSPIPPPRLKWIGKS